MKEPKIMYIANFTDLQIREIEVVREIYGAVWVKEGSREKHYEKYSTWHEIHPSWAEAHSALIKYVETQIAAAKSIMLNWKIQLSNIKNMEQK